MKKLVLSCVGVLLAFSLSGCGALVDTDTPKSSELSSQYDFYSDSANELRSTMGITPEQADEVFILLAEHGLNSEINSVSKNQKDGGDYFSVNWSGNTFTVYLSDGTVSKIEDSREGGKVVYPVSVSSESESSEPESEAPATLEEAIDSAISEARAEKGSVNVIDNGETENKNVEIHLVGKDNLSVNMIRSGMLIQANDILKALQSRTDISEIGLFWTFPLIDSYGNSSSQTVMKVFLKKETLDKINFDNFDWNKFPEIADDYYEHAALSE